MKQYYIDEKTGISYTLQGDYYLPDLALPAEKGQLIGIWGQRHLRYLKECHRITYANLLTSGKLNSYLVDIDERAENCRKNEGDQDKTCPVHSCDRSLGSCCNIIHPS